MKQLLSSFIFALLVLSLQAQQLDKLKEEEPVTFGGSLYLSGGTYQSFAAGSARQSPWYYSLTGSPVLTIYGLSVPFSLSFANQQFSFSQPFNRYGLSPAYKWARLHLGWRYMSFSPLVLSGREFLGAGLELEPERFRFGLLYGTLQNYYAQRDTAVYGAYLLDAYRRRILGARIGFGEHNTFDLSVLKVVDDTTTTSALLADNTYLLPEENVVIGIDVQLSLLRSITLQLHQAASLHTGDRTMRTLDDAELDPTVQRIFDALSPLIVLNASTRPGLATHLNASFHNRFFTLSLAYRRVDPYYRSLGMYYNANDYEHYTANLGCSLFEQRLNLNLTAGLQRNNLFNLRPQTDLRRIASLSMTYVSRKGFYANAFYNNYQTDQSAGYIQVADTLRLALVNETATLSTGHSWKTPTRSHNLSFNIYYLNFRDINPLFYIPLQPQSNYSGSVTYRIGLLPAELDLGLSANYNLLTNGANQQQALGLTLDIGKRLADNKLSVNGSFTLNFNQYNGQSDGLYYQFNTNAAWALNEQHSINFYALWLRRQSQYTTNEINELRSGISYAFNF